MKRDLTVKELAASLGRSMDYVQKRVSEGQLPFTGDGYRDKKFNLKECQDAIAYYDEKQSSGASGLSGLDGLPANIQRNILATRERLIVERRSQPTRGKYTPANGGSMLKHLARLK